MGNRYDVFISFKNLDKNGQRTRDSVMAEQLYYALAAKGIRAFYSNISINENSGGDYMTAIDRAIEDSLICVAVGTSVENLESSWVREELRSFRTQMDSGSKSDPRCAMYSYITGDVPADKLPAVLGSCRVFTDQAALVNMICTRLGNRAGYRGAADRGNGEYKTHNNSRYDVFISFKNLDKNGRRTRDSHMAEELYYALEAKGIHTFYSNISIDKDGDSDFVDAIDQAIEEAVICVAVGSCIENLKSPWVADELKSFRIEMNNGNKPSERCAMYSYITKDVPTNKLPGKLKSCQVFYELQAIVDAVSSRFQKERDVMQNFIPKVAVDVGLAPGTILDGKYKILSKIGQGGMSIVYLAMNEKANKQWAVKEVRKYGIRDFEVVKQGLVAEIDILKKLSHPALPAIVDVIDTSDSFVIVMDYIEGNSLARVLEENGPQPEELVVGWAKQLCDVLGYLHSRTPAIIYRDMKPANLMLNPRGNLTLIDFGTAREYKEKNLADTTCLGTIGYAAPEQFGGMGQTDPRTDIYCLGVTLHHLVTGSNPAKPPYELYPIRQINPELSYGLEAIIAKCVQRDPDLRYQTAAAMLEDLENISKLDAKLRRKARGFWPFGGKTAQKSKKKTADAAAPGRAAVNGKNKPEPLVPVFAETTILQPEPMVESGVPAAPIRPVAVPKAPAGYAIPGQPVPKPATGFAIPGQPVPKPATGFAVPGQLAPKPATGFAVSGQPVPVPLRPAPMPAFAVPRAAAPVPVQWDKTGVLSAPVAEKKEFIPTDPGTASLSDRVAVCLSVGRQPKEDGTVDVYFATKANCGRIVQRIAAGGGYKRVVMDKKLLLVHANDVVTIRLEGEGFSFQDGEFSFLWGDHVSKDSCGGYAFHIDSLRPDLEAKLKMELFLGGEKVMEKTVLFAGSEEETDEPRQPVDMQNAKPYLIRTKNRERILVNKPVFRLGTERSYVDYYIGDNKAVSRSHADVITRDREYYVVDTSSSNYTYVNGEKIQANVETKLSHGTVIRLANEEFEFRFC